MIGYNSLWEGFSFSRHCGAASNSKAKVLCVCPSSEQMAQVQMTLECKPLSSLPNCNYSYVLLIETVLSWLVWFFVFYREKKKFSAGLVDQLWHNQHKTRLNWLIDKAWGASTVIYIPGQLEMAAGSSLILVTLLVNNKKRHGELLFVWQEEYMEVIWFIVSRLCSNI